MSLIITLILTDEGPPLMTLFDLNHFPRGPISKYNHIGDTGFNIGIGVRGRHEQLVHNTFYNIQSSLIYNYKVMNLIAVCILGCFAVFSCELHGSGFLLCLQAWGHVFVGGVTCSSL